VAKLPSTDEDKEQVCPTEMSDHKNEDENHRSETCGETNERRKLSEHMVDVAGKDEAEVNRTWVLGSIFCTYLKSFRVGNNRQFFHQAHGHWTREWTIYLKYVNQIMKN
jgi:hypothetical protein